MVFAGASLLFFLSYFLNGVKNWGWLFPAFIFAGLALTIWLATNDFEGSYLGAPILAAIAIPFYVGFAVERKSWGLLIPAFVLTVLSLITIIADTAPGEWIGAIVLLSVGLPFLVAYLLDRNKRWALIPATILIVLSIVTLVSTFAAGEWIGALVLYAIGLIFLGIFLFDHSKRWALIPAAVLAVVGTIPLIAAFTGGDLTGTVVMFLFALPFLVIYFWSKNNWWALIPGGVFASIGLVVLLSMLLPKMDKIWEGFLRRDILPGADCNLCRPLAASKDPANGLGQISGSRTFGCGSPGFHPWQSLRRFLAGRCIACCRCDAPADRIQEESRE